MSGWSFTVPGLPPSVNHAYRPIRTKNGTMSLAKSSEALAYQVGAAYIVKVARPSGWVAARRVRITYRMWFNREGRDASNAIKLLEDAIAEALGVNDKTFIPCVELVEVDKFNPRVELTIENAE